MMIILGTRYTITNTVLFFSLSIPAQVLEQKDRTRLLRFTAAAYHHLSALRIQRTYRLHMVLNRAKKHVNWVICIQVSFSSAGKL